MGVFKKFGKHMGLLSLILGNFQLNASDKPILMQDIDGNAVSIWQTYTSNGLSIQANVYDCNYGWSSPVTLTERALSYQPQLAIKNRDKNISAVTIWIELADETTRLYGSMMSNLSDGWSAPVQISTNTENVSSYNLDINSAGSIKVIWNSHSLSGVQSTRFSTAELDTNNLWMVPQTISGS